MLVRKLIMAWAGAVIVALVAPGAVSQAAQAAASQGDVADFGVTVIHASRSEGGVDPALQDIARYLQKSFARYTSFKRLEKQDVKVRKDETGRLKLPDGKSLGLKYLGADQGFVKVHLTVDTLKTTIKVKDGGLFFQAGRVFEDGILVLAIRARASSAP